MSVDLVGSTAFKAKYNIPRGDKEPYPAWLNITKRFYREFPTELSNFYERFAPQHHECLSIIKTLRPQVWKTVGDEIVFCCGLDCLEHLALCMTAFVSTLEKYGRDLHDQEPELDVKGSAWIASFPAPNITIHSAVRTSDSKLRDNVGDTLNENDESKADQAPGEYDFLGKSIDTGFRISKFAQADELALSIELAWLLALLKQLRLVGFDFIFRGREPLKGVIKGIPYPVVTIETEKSPKLKELLSLERNVTRSDFADTVTLRNYLHSFMENHEVDVPILELYKEKGETELDKYPQCYRDFNGNYKNCIEWQERQDEEIQASETAAADDRQPDNAMTARVTEFAAKAKNKIETTAVRIGRPIIASEGS